jgi:hypothetical protein
MGQRVLACSVLFFLGSIKGQAAGISSAALEHSNLCFLDLPFRCYAVCHRGQRKKIGKDVIQKIKYKSPEQIAI